VLSDGTAKLSELLALLGADVDESLDELRHGAGEREPEHLRAPPLAAPLRRGARLGGQRADGAPCLHVRRAGPEHEPPAAAEVALDERLEPRRWAPEQLQHAPEREVGVLGVGGGSALRAPAGVLSSSS
jgi:hypothetical protein